MTVGFWNVFEKYGFHDELFIIFNQKEPFAFTQVVECRPHFTAETWKACALLGLHMIAEEADSSSCRGFSLELGPRNLSWKTTTDFRQEARVRLAVVCASTILCVALWISWTELVKRGGGVLSRRLGADAGRIELPHGR